MHTDFNTAQPMRELPEPFVKPMRLYNPEGLDYKNGHRIKSIEVTEAYTRIDFIYRSPFYYVNGGWIRIEPKAYVRPVGTTNRYALKKAEGISLAPARYHFKACGVYHTYTLFYEALPPDTTCIDIIEKEAPGNYFNFYGVEFSSWMLVPHPVDLPRCTN